MTIAPSLSPSPLPIPSSHSDPPQSSSAHPKLDIRPNDRVSYASSSDNPTDLSKRIYRTVRVLRIKESEVIAVGEDEEKSIVHLKWAEVLPPF